jgi:hypothetical protein
MNDKPPLRSETQLLREILIHCSNGSVRLFRNTVGSAWVGVSRWVDGMIVVHRPTRVTFGLSTGSADIVGWRTITITPEMVGQQIAQFVSIEAKAKRGKMTAEQQAWLDTVYDAGGVAVVARSLEDAKQAVGVE